jgi:hypothetical protein
MASDTQETAAERTVIYLGNRNAVTVLDGERVPLTGKLCTRVVVRPDATLMEAVTEITSPNGVWRAHSDGSPAWVAAEGPGADAITQILAAHYKCAIREAEPDQEV